MSPLHRIDVDGEMDGLILEIQLNPAPPLCKILGISHHQRARSFQAVQNRRQIFVFGPADESDLADCQIIGPAHAANHDFMLIDSLASDAAVEHIPERIGAHDAQNKRGSLGGDRLGRPIHELCEIVEERRLNFVFGDPSRLCPAYPQPRENGAHRGPEKQ